MMKNVRIRNQNGEKSRERRKKILSIKRKDSGIVGVLGNDYQQLKTSVDFFESSRTMNSKVTTLSDNPLKT